MKDRLKNNIGLKITAVVFAILLWWAVVNIDDPVDVKTYSVGVTVTNPEVITNAGKSYQIVDNTGTVSVTVKARRKVLADVRRNDIVATADLREMQDTSVPIRVSITGFEGEYEEISANPRNIQVKVENTQKKTFPITCVASGIPRDGYVVGAMTASPQTVDISGPESLIAKISKVVAKVDVSELAKDTALQTTLLYYDAADNLIDQSRLTSNCDKSGMSVYVDLWKTKELPLHFDTSAIDIARGYVLAEIEVEPKTIEVAGSPDKLSQMTEVHVGKEALKMDDLSANQEVLVDIDEYLPEGITLADADLGNVVVRIMVEKAGTKSIRIPAESIEVTNLSTKLQLSYGEQLEVELTFTGSAEALENLSSEQIKASINLETYKEKGTYEVPVLITSLPGNCTYVEGTTVKIELTKK